MLAASRGPKSRPSLEGATKAVAGEETPTTVLPSSTELFYFYAQNLEQCAKLSNRKPLWDLLAVHKKWLKIYAGESRGVLRVFPSLLITFAYQRMYSFQVSKGEVSLFDCDSPLDSRPLASGLQSPTGKDDHLKADSPKLRRRA